MTAFEYMALPQTQHHVKVIIQKSILTVTAGFLWTLLVVSLTSSLDGSLPLVVVWGCLQSTSGILGTTWTASLISLLLLLCFGISGV